MLMTTSAISPATPTQAEIIAGLSRLPGLSPAVQAILPRLGDEAFDAGELAQMVGKDPVLAARVLRLANSPFYGLSRQIGSLREAVAILGFGSLRGLVLSAGVISAFSASDRAGARRSLAAAATAAVLAAGLGLERNTPFTAALLHNLGALLLGHFAPQPWAALAAESNANAADASAHLDLERRVFGYDHCELGAEITRHWNFPVAIQHAIRHYPLPSAQPAASVSDLTHAAWVIVTAIENDTTPVFDAGVSQRLGLASPAAEAPLAAAMQAAREQF
jgi:HD-like signal output (HDOD) protein